MTATSIAPGERLTDAIVLELVARSIAGGRFDELHELVEPGVRLRALLPRGPEEREGADAVVARIRDWFGRGEPIRADRIAVQPLADRWLLAYDFTVGDGPSRQFVAQQCVCDVNEGRLAAIDLVCTGYRNAPGTVDGEIRRFDAGMLGCADGLSEAFREQRKTLAIGQQIEVVVRDAAAREDLPALARLMGDRVIGIVPGADGASIITVERVR